MNSVLVLLLSCAPGQACTGDAFPEWLLWPVDYRGRREAAIAVDNRGSFVAFTSHVLVAPDGVDPAVVRVTTKQYSFDELLFPPVLDLAFEETLDLLER